MRSGTSLVTMRFLSILGVWLVIACTLGPIPIHASKNRTVWSKEIPIIVSIDRYAQITADPEEWHLTFSGRGRASSGGWLFVAEPEGTGFTVHSNTAVHVSLSGGGGLGKSKGINPTYTFTSPDGGKDLTYTSRPPDPAGPATCFYSIASPTGEQGVVFQLKEAAIRANSLNDVPAGEKYATTLTVTVAAADH